MKRNEIKRIKLTKTTVHALQAPQLANVQGGVYKLSQGCISVGLCD